MSRRNFFLAVLFVSLGVALWLRGPELLTPLHKRLVSSEPRIRNMAFIKLNKMKDPAKVHLVPDLLTHVQSEDPTTRRYALYSLRKIGNTTDEVYKAAVQSLSDESPSVREEAIAVTLNAAKNIIPTLIPVLDEMSPSFKQDVVEALGKQGADLVEPLITALKSENASHRSHAALILWKIGKEAKDAEADLLTALRDKDRDTRIYSALALSQINPQEGKIVGPLAESLSREKWEEPQYAALVALGELGKKARKAKRVLDKAFEGATDGFGEGGPYKKAEVARTLNKVDPRLTNYNGLNWDLKNKRPLLRYRAALFIADMEKPERTLIKPLVRTLDDKNPYVFSRVVQALGNLELKSSSRFHNTIVSKITKSVGRIESKAKIKGYNEMAATVLTQFESSLFSPTLTALQKKEITPQQADVVLSKLQPNVIGTLSPYLDYKDPLVVGFAAVQLKKAGFSDQRIESALQKAATSSNKDLADVARPWVGN